MTFRAWNSTSTPSESEVDTSHGMNFAYGGSGVFDTKYGTPNMTFQIGLLEKLIATEVLDTASSMAVVALSGNDYLSYLTTNGSILVIQYYPS